jgi:uncharacterized protein
MNCSIATPPSQPAAVSVGRPAAAKPTWLGARASLPAERSFHSVDLDVTESCNLACIYCFKWQKKAVHMDEATAKSAIDWLLDASGANRDLRVNLMGGEPTLRFELIQKIVPYGKMRARQLGKSLHFGCTTNCTTLTDEILEFWRRFGMGFHCSIDGVPEVQNANRPLLSGGPSAAAVERNVPKILAYRPEAMARATLSPASVRYLLASAKYLAALGFRSMTFKAAVNCNWSPDDFNALREQYAELAGFYVERLVSGQPLNIEELAKGLRSVHSPAARPKFPCGAGRGLALVDPRGAFWPCHRFGPHQCGGQFTFGQLGAPFNDRLRSVFLNYDVEQDSKAGCQGCPAALTCRSWCYAECVDCMQSFYDPGREYCEVNRIVNAQVIQVYDRLRSNHPDALKRVLQDERQTKPGASRP